MSLFDTILTQPILNLLAFIYNYIGDFGVAIIILTIIVRIIIWPLVKKQLQQAKLMREIQPALQDIKKKAAGNRMVEATMMMALYKEKGIKPFSSIVVLLIQLPIMIAIFRVIQIFSGGGNPSNFIYGHLANFGNIPNLLSAGHQLTFFGMDLAKSALVYWPALILVFITAILQYIQIKQMMPVNKKTKKVRDLLKQAAGGEEIDQADMMAATSRNMTKFMPAMMLVIAAPLPAAVVLYYSATSVIAIIQQYRVLNKPIITTVKKSNTKTAKVSQRELNAQPAVIIKKSSKSTAKKSDSNSGKTVVRRIKAK